jgi:hypothetical protein
MPNSVHSYFDVQCKLNLIIDGCDEHSHLIDERFPLVNTNLSLNCKCSPASLIEVHD